MQPSNLSVFQRLTAKMRWLTERQTVIAQNVANVDTPGFQARELKPLNFRSQLNMGMAEVKGGPGLGAVSLNGIGSVDSGPGAGEVKHMRLASASHQPNTQDFRHGQEQTISGNSVDLEHELKKSSDTALEYQTMSHLYRKQLELLRMAVQSNNG